MIVIRGELWAVRGDRGGNTRFEVAGSAFAVQAVREQQAEQQCREQQQTERPEGRRVGSRRGRGRLLREHSVIIAIPEQGRVVAPFSAPRHGRVVTPLGSVRVGMPRAIL
ncbi:hypothetical protein OHS71_08660 [Streptomyces sp. NBC_00377]|uniref:hypothetical protein n=1 Tax=unclassified Streptomyces TaxID=2593676 RepID=UPI002E2060D9|nr:MULTISPECIES: hypothetical protein [unclassified Streptomyces]